ncbi:MAG: hypothetical protein QOE46_506 [Acidobacteriota bacterium]|jgi:hypothetical protein|nr:hypothetical protein [Acidobacteriota bacterium]
MDINPRIKVIKLAERKRRARVRVRKTRASVLRLGQDTERDAAATVTGWVEELRQQKHQSPDAVDGFNSLFEDVK